MSLKQETELPRRPHTPRWLLLALAVLGLLTVAYGIAGTTVRGVLEALLQH